jgi:hypothetical protein
MRAPFVAALLAASCVFGPVGGDTTPPNRADGSPAGVLPSSTITVTMTLTTDESAHCSYSEMPGVAYERMEGTFGRSDGTHHFANIGVSSGGKYAFYVRCEDDAGNADLNDYEITFSVSP